MSDSTSCLTDLIADGFAKVGVMGRRRDQVADAVCDALEAIEATPKDGIQMLALPDSSFHTFATY